MLKTDTNQLEVDLYCRLELITISIQVYLTCVFFLASFEKSYFSEVLLSILFTDLFIWIKGAKHNKLFVYWYYVLMNLFIWLYLIQFIFKDTGPESAMLRKLNFR